MNLGIEHESLPSIISDPFFNSNVTGINIFYRDYDKWTGSIDFKSGNTSGTQKLVSSPDIYGIITQIKTIVDLLKSKQ